jgi:hypothetical protein
MINARQLTRCERLILGAAALASSLAQNVEAGQDPSATVCAAAQSAPKPLAANRPGFPVTITRISANAVPVAV